MKTTIKIFAAVLLLAISSTGCEDLQSVTPSLGTPPSPLSANFLFVNGSPDAPSLDLFVNNVKTGTSTVTGTAQSVYSNVTITTDGVGANTAIRAKASTGTIGGVLDKSDLIFRAGNTNTNNFVAAAGGSYTLIAVDTIKRPKPLRTLNGQNFGDVTYYSSVGSFVSDTTIQLDKNNSIVIANLIKKHNGGNLPSTFIPIGVVPLGSSDVGGPRFLLITDDLPLPATSPVFPVPTTGNFAVRFIHASPDAGSISCFVGATQLKSGLSVNASGVFSYVMTQGNFNPTVGSRAATTITAAPLPVYPNGFANNFAAAAGGPYDIAIKSGATTIASLNAQTFADGGIYTIVLSGSKAKGTLAVTLIKNK